MQWASSFLSRRSPAPALLLVLAAAALGLALLLPQQAFAHPDHPENTENTENTEPPDPPDPPENNVDPDPPDPPQQPVGPAITAPPQPSEADFEWTGKHDIEALDGDHSTPTGMWSDGAVLWLLHNADGAADAAYAYDLKTGERAEEREFELEKRNRAPRGIWSDGTGRVWVGDSGRERLFAYDLSSGERLDDRDIELRERNAHSRGIWSDGQTMWVLDERRNAVFAYDLESGALLAEYALDPANGSPQGIWSDGVTLWVSDPSSPPRLFAYRLPAREEVEAAGEGASLERVGDEDFTELGRVGNSSPRGIWSDGALMYVADANDGKVYTYNIPDAIDARLASLALEGVAIGAFSPLRTDYAGVPAEGVTTTVVTAETAQRRTTVVVEPPDAHERTAGHQVALEGVAEITVTVTSADGSRTRVYRVALEVTAEEPWAHCLKGAVAAGFSLLVYEGGSVEELAACAESRGVRGLYALHEGRYVAYLPEAPGFVNEAFAGLYPEVVPALTPLVAASDGPASEDPVGELAAPGDWPGCLRGEFVEDGFSLVLYEGGTVEELAACARGDAVVAAWALHEGEWVSYIRGAPEFVNRSFATLFADGVPPLTPLVVRSEPPSVPSLATTGSR